MNYSVIEIKSTTQSQLATEVAYSVASARAHELEFVKLIHTDGDTIRNNMLKILKNMLKKGRIQLYIEEGEYYGGAKEALYLRNKNPELCSVCTEGGQGILVKL